MNTVDKRYTAILTTFNAENTVTRALESISRQTHAPTEIIIVDDCSLDNTLLVIRDFQGTSVPIKIFVNKRNLGQSWGRNFAVKESQTNFVVFFDDDDYSLPERSTIHLKHFSNGSEISYVSSEKEYPNSYAVRFLNHAVSLQNISFEDAFKLIFLGVPLKSSLRVFVPSSTLAATKSSYVRLDGFDIKLRRLEDMDFFLKAVACDMRIAWSDVIGVRRFHTTGNDKDAGQDSVYEEILIERYGKYVSKKLSDKANSVGKLRKVYFSGNYMQFLSLVFTDPRTIPIAFLKISVLVRRLRHERFIRGRI
jgi:glycosyltransferase involved in cell wall biosynthesis